MSPAEPELPFDSPVKPASHRLWLRTGLWLVAVLLLIPCLMALTVSLVDWNRTRPWVAARVSEASGRYFDIRGGLKVHRVWPQPLDSGWRQWVPGLLVEAQGLEPGNRTGFRSFGALDAPPARANENGALMAQVAQASANLRLLTLRNVAVDYPVDLEMRAGTRHPMGIAFPGETLPGPSALPLDNSSARAIHQGWAADTGSAALWRCQGSHQRPGKHGQPQQTLGHTNSGHGGRAHAVGGVSQGRTHGQEPWPHGRRICAAGQGKLGCVCIVGSSRAENSEYPVPIEK